MFPCCHSISMQEASMRISSFVVVAALFSVSATEALAHQPSGYPATSDDARHSTGQQASSHAGLLPGSKNAAGLAAPGTPQATSSQQPLCVRNSAGVVHC